jgi:hypothetical protein
MVVNGLIAITVMAFAGTASAITTFDIQDGNILAIGNLELNWDNDELDGFYNIIFVNDTGDNQYGVDPVFDVPAGGEEAAIILPQINDAINLAPGLVSGASAAGTDVYFIPGLVPFQIDRYVAAGGENLGGGVWGRCENDCIASITALRPGDVNTFARVTVVPEPGTTLLLGLGLTGLGVVGRKRRQESKATA